MTHDVIVIGGSYAGMAAALQLLRARRNVLVIDAGERRNRLVSHAYGLVGQDGVDPAEIARTARTQLEAYPNLTWIDGRAIAATGAKDDFSVTLEDGQVHRGRRILFANGVTDKLPEIDGLMARWSKTVFLCPYCHGYELDEGEIAVIATGPMSVHQAELLPEWGKVTFFTNAALTLDPETRQRLTGRGVTIEETPILRLDGVADVVLTDGRRLPFAGIFTASQCRPSSPVAEEMGCALMETPMGVLIETDEGKATSLPGVFACGDTARMPHSLSLAIGDGAWAGAQIHRSLVFPEA